MMDFDPFILTLKLASITTVVLLLIGVPLGYWLAYSPARGKVMLEALVGLPLVLPPTVLGFYLLVAFSPENAFGNFLENYLDIRLVFSFPGLVIASVIYSLPFMIQPLQSGFRTVPENLINASYLLGKNKRTTLFKVILPQVKNALLTGCILTFAHTIGEFGVVLMIGGNIPQETRVISVAIYDQVEAMNYAQANMYSGILLAFSFIVLLVAYMLNNRMVQTNFQV
jgi:molybdate transport system permease protein